VLEAGPMVATIFVAWVGMRSFMESPKFLWASAGKASKVAS
jgi:hypothetical protein